MRSGTILLAATLAVGSTACAPIGEYVWSDQYRAPIAASGQYLISRGDLISVRVFNQEGMSAKVRVRADGQISLPFLGDVDAVGLPPEQLATRLQTRFKEFIVNPVVTVALEEPRPIEVYLLGEVAHPGRFVMEPGTSVLQALAAAGGLTPFAGEDRLFVLRREPAPVRIRFRLEALTQDAKASAAFILRAGDTIVVE